MNGRIEALKALATKEVWSENQYNGAPEHDGYELDVDMFAQLIAQESIVDFYRRYLDICSEEDITVQVERYVKEHFTRQDQWLANEIAAEIRKEESVLKG